MKIKFNDGSTYELSKEFIEATKMKYGFAEDPQVARHHKAHVEKCWKKRTYHDKFGEHPWSYEFETMTELASKCIYADIRGAVMGIMLKKMGSNMKIMVIGNKKTRTYPTEVKKMGEYPEVIKAKVTTKQKKGLVKLAKKNKVSVSEQIRNTLFKK